MVHIKYFPKKSKSIVILFLNKKLCLFISSNNFTKFGRKRKKNKKTSKKGMKKIIKIMKTNK
jgi:hypothetical protein